MVSVPVMAQEERFGSVAGIAIDSLREAPLAGALVTVEGAGLSETTDSAGLFRIDSIPAGVWRLVLFHPLLDTLRIHLVTPAFAVAADSTLNVVIAIPAATTVLRLKCGSDSGAALFGGVSRADDPFSPSGAIVRLGWIETEIGRGIGVRNTPKEVTAAVGDDGMFQLCGVPPDVFGDLVAISGSDTSAAVAVFFEEGFPVNVVGVVLPGADVERVAPAGEPFGAAVSGDQQAAAQVTPGLRRGRAVISGAVRDASGSPVEGAHVSLDGAAGAATTDSSGRFVLANQPSGSGVLTIRKLGFAMVEVPVTASAAQASEVNVRMSQTVPLLSEVVVRATRDLALARVGFLERRYRRPGSFFLGPDQMHIRRNRMSLANVLGEAPNLRYAGAGQLRGRSGGISGLAEGMMVMGSPRCLQYLVDGFPWPPKMPPPTEHIQPDEVAAVEVYRSEETPGDLPFASLIRFNDRGEPCDVVVIWTHQKLRTM